MATPALHLEVDRMLQASRQRGRPENDGTAAADSPSIGIRPQEVGTVATIRRMVPLPRRVETIFDDVVRLFRIVWNGKLIARIDFES